ncbi:MAG: hypothetical protein ABIU95_13200 [Burkholderiales bacterium]
MKTPLKRRAHGGALLELAIAVSLCATVGCGVAVPLAAQVDLERERQTAMQMSELRTVLLGYAMANGRLPCPADAHLPDAHPLAGREAAIVANECAGGYSGAVPWATLGTPSIDAFGRRYRYRVARDLANGWDECHDRASAADSPSICLTAPKPDSHPANALALEVRERRRGGSLAAGSESIAAGLAVVLISHGANGHFGTNTAGRAVAGDQHAVRDEARNAAPTTVSFMVRTRAPGQSGCDDDRAGAPLCAFDDLVRWISRAELSRDLARAEWAR